MDTRTLIMAGVSSLGVIVSAIAGGNNLGNLGQGRELYQDLRADTKLTEIREQKRIADQQTAEDRYKTCVPYVSGDSKKGFKFPALHESLVIRDRETNLPLPDDYLICDAHGGTALLKNGKPTDIKYTGNREVVLKRISRYRGGVYSQPIINNYSQPYTHDTNETQK